MTNLAKTIAAYQQKHDVSAKTMAADLGFSASTLTRLKQGLMPDAAGILKIMNWLVRES